MLSMLTLVGGENNLDFYNGTSIQFTFYNTLPYKIKLANLFGGGGTQLAASLVNLCQYFD